MKKVIIIILAVLIAVVLGLGGFLMWKISSKLDAQGNDIKTLLNSVVEENKNTVNAVNTNNVVNNAVSNSTNNSVGSNVVSSITTTTNTTTDTNTTNVQTSTTSSETEQVKEAYTRYLKKMPTYVEIKINKVDILTAEQKKALLEYDGGQFYKDTDILATVSYDVKLQEGAQDAGNGEKNGDWVVNKSACVCYRDGEIVQAGTGW